MLALCEPQFALSVRPPHFDNDFAGSSVRPSRAVKRKRPIGLPAALVNHDLHRLTRGKEVVLAPLTQGDQDQPQSQPFLVR
jgi:hypothetical protein